MDLEIQTNIDELIGEFKKTGLNVDDPVAKLMMSTLVHQAQKIKDEIAELPSKIVERLCSTFIPANKTKAIPALCMVQPMLKNKKGVEVHHLIDGSVYTFKADTKRQLSFYPLYRNRILPYTALHILTHKFLRTKGNTTPLNLTRKGYVWIGLEVPAEIETLETFSFLLKGTNGVLPKAIYVDRSNTELLYTTAENAAEIPMMEPFDAQQANFSFIDIISGWRNTIANMADGKLIYIIDKLRDRDAFKCKAFPKIFQQMLESRDLDRFEDNTLWLLLDFGDEYNVPDDIDIIPNVVPVVNVNINTVTLTPTSPIAKLTKDDGSFFLNVIETSLPAQKQGFNTLNDEIIIRDFDSSCYNPALLNRQVRELYNHFIDDYHAFIDYHGLKDGELIRSLRELVNKIGKSVTTAPDVKSRYDDGTYAMRSVSLSGQTFSVKVSYLTSYGRLGNLPKSTNVMENKKDAAIEKDVTVIVNAMGGEDKASADQRYELLRYYTLTADRLYSKMDIDAFTRMQLLKEFGKDEARRISYEISIQGAGGAEKVVRGLYIHIHFKDLKNYRKATEMSLDQKLQQLIIEKSCISMPVIVKLCSVE